MKSLLNKYISSHVRSAIGAVCLMLLGLQIFMLFVAEMGTIGQGGYGVFNAFLFVLMQMPYHVYLFFPIACLLGVLLGLGMLANHSELLVMRASGISPANIASSVFKSVAGLVLIVCLLGEFVCPKIIHFSEDWKTSLRTGGQAIRTAHGLWLRQNSSFIHIEHVPSKTKLVGIHQYRFNNKHQLIMARYVDHANYKNGTWHLNNIENTYFSALNKKQPKITVDNTKNKIWSLKLSPNMLISSDLDPNEMSLLQLAKLIIAKRNSHLDPGHFEMNFWRRVFQPLATFVMVLLAMPFIFGSIRSMSVGQRFLLGTAVGFLFHILNEFAIPISQIYQVPPLLAASMPMIFFALVGAILITRVK